MNVSSPQVHRSTGPQVHRSTLPHINECLQSTSRQVHRSTGGAKFTCFSKLVTPLWPLQQFTTNNIHKRKSLIRELLLRCTHFGKWTLDLSTSDRIIFKRSYICRGSPTGLAGCRIWLFFRGDIRDLS